MKIIRLFIALAWLLMGSYLFHLAMAGLVNSAPPAPEAAPPPAPEA